MTMPNLKKFCPAVLTPCPDKQTDRQTNRFSHLYISKIRQVKCEVLFKKNFPGCERRIVDGVYSLVIFLVTLPSFVSFFPGLLTLYLSFIVFEIDDQNWQQKRPQIIIILQISRKLFILDHINVKKLHINKYTAHLLSLNSLFQLTQFLSWSYF